MRKPKFNPIQDNVVIEVNSGRSANNEFTSLVRCRKCGNTKHVRSSYICKQQQQGKFTGLCISCAAKERNQKWTDGFHPRYSGHKKPTWDGYISITLKSLRDDPCYEIARLMAWTSGRVKRVLEHRFVMAKHIGRALTESEIVHHKNGNKSDNRKDNLELLTIKTHHSGHGDIYYQKWQEALAEIERLKRHA